MECQAKAMGKLSDKKLMEKLENVDLDFLYNLKEYLDDIYYNTDISSGFKDYQYDLLCDVIETRGLAPSFGFINREENNRVTLPYWMGSLNKIKFEEEASLNRWLKNNLSCEYIYEDKLDGVSCLIDNTKMGIKIYTRGRNGIGADISFILPYINYIPFDLPLITVRGELIMKKKIFEEKYASKYATARNMVAGRTNGKMIKEGMYDIDFVAYEIINQYEVESPSSQLLSLKKLGFETVFFSIVSTVDIADLVDLYIKRRNDNTYNIDGIVVQSNIPYIRNITGNPSYAFAFKMRLSTNVAETEVIQVKWRTTRRGFLIPRIQLKPVKLEGVIINYTSGFNARFIMKHKIGPGSLLEITRSGDVIPIIVRVIRESVAQMPFCEYKWCESGNDVYPTISDPDEVIRSMTFFFKTIGVKHVDYETIKKLYESNYDSILKILLASKNDLLTIPKFKTKSVNRIYNGLHSSLQNISLSTLINASGKFGFGFGQKRIENLLTSIPDIFVLYKKNIIELEHKLESVDGISNKYIYKILNNISKVDDFIQEISSFVTYAEKHISSDNDLNISVVFSGFRDNHLENAIKMKGGCVENTVTSKTGCVIVDNKDVLTGKIKRAQKNRIPCYTKEEFIELYLKNYSLSK